jgi:hypothetical protein
VGKGEDEKRGLTEVRERIEIGESGEEKDERKRKQIGMKEETDRKERYEERKEKEKEGNKTTGRREK